MEAKIIWQTAQFRCVQVGWCKNKPSLVFEMESGKDALGVSHWVKCDDYETALKEFSRQQPEIALMDKDDSDSPFC